FAYPGFGGGVFVAAGDVNGDSRAEIITGVGSAAPPHLKVFNAAGATLASFFVNNPFAPYAVPNIVLETGLRVAVADFNGDGILDVAAAKGHGNYPLVWGFEEAGPAQLDLFFAFDKSYAGGLFLGGSL